MHYEVQMPAKLEGMDEEVLTISDFPTLTEAVNFVTDMTGKTRTERVDGGPGDHFEWFNRYFTDDIQVAVLVCRTPKQHRYTKRTRSLR